MKQSALQCGSFLTRLHHSMKLSEVYNSPTKCPRILHIIPLCLEKGMQHQSLFTLPTNDVQGQDASRSGGENLDFETLSPFQQPVYAVPRLCLCFALSQKALKVSLSSRLCSQGCTFHRGQGSTAHAGQ